MKVTRAVCAAYACACLFALILTVANGLGWLASNLASTLTDVLGAPWSLLVARMADPGAVGELVLVAAAMVLNLAIIFATGRWLAQRT